MEKTYISPFWSLKAGTDKEEITGQLEQWKRRGIYSVTVEYNSGDSDAPAWGEECFKMFDWLVEACRELDMQFWIQDAAPFPTGQAGGALRKEENAHLRKCYIGEQHVDVTGPYPDAQIHMGQIMRGGAGLLDIFGGDLKKLEARKHLVLAAYQCDSRGRLIPGTGQVLDSYVQDEILYWDVPEGTFRIFCVYTTSEGGGRWDYVNLLDPESVKLQIEYVHTPVYEHLKKELGRTWEGFFYDELEIGNQAGYDFFMLPGSRRAGESGGVLPWSEKLYSALSAKEGNFLVLLPLLWYEAGREHSRVRYQYMECVTRLAGRIYNGQVYQWCREHGVPYTGHVLEDENSHTRLGCGTGHYFRIQKEQDMSAVDMIGGQVMPQNDNLVNWYGNPDGDGCFYHYGLAKLASSAAHIDPLKGNRSLCEVFALYGNICSIRLRKFILDHLFVNGINHLIYADAGETQTPDAYWKQLNDYGNQMCRILNGTTPVIKTAILYHAEAEWSGKFQFFHLPARELARRQISYDVIPADVFSEKDAYCTETREGLVINHNRYEALIIPYSEYLPETVAEFVLESRQNGFPVFFVDGMPVGTCEGNPFRMEELKKLAENGCGVYSVALEQLAEAVKEVIEPDLEIQGSFPWLRYSHVRSGEGDYYLMHNESRLEVMEFTARLQGNGKEVYRLDCIGRFCTKAGEKDSLAIKLLPFEAAVFMTGDILPWPEKESRKTGSGIKHQEAWSITLEKDGKTFTRFTSEELFNINDKAHFPSFAGKIIYESTAFFGEDLPEIMDLGKVYDACSVYCNGQLAGHCISAPYTVALKGIVRPGKNEIRVEVFNNMAHEPGKEGFPLKYLSVSDRVIQEPGGLLGPVKYL